jgi:GrpB-like predicted nucleotidyltransferase (UPF0157 family)
VIDEGALIGGRERREIMIVDYDLSWPERFESERVRLSGALGPLARAIEHVGSTAVPGLAAKPIIDVLVMVGDPEEESLLAPIEAVGYELRVRERAHRMFRTRGRDVHVHLYGADDQEVQRMLGFRDRLRASSRDRSEYERLKRELARRSWPDMNAYADAKGPLIESILTRAEG